MSEDVGAVSAMPRGDESELLRAGVRSRVKRLAETAEDTTRPWSPSALVSMLSAGVLGRPLATKADGTTAAAAAVEALIAIGGNVLAEVIKAELARLDGDARERSAEDVEAELERRILEILQAGGEQAKRLREEYDEFRFVATDPPTGQGPGVRAGGGGRTLLTALITAVVVALVTAVTTVQAQEDSDRLRDDAVSRRLALQSGITSDPALSALLAAAA